MDEHIRAISHALRHEAWLYELELDEEGWADVGALLAAVLWESAALSGLAGQDWAGMSWASF